MSQVLTFSYPDLSMWQGRTDVLGLKTSERPPLRCEVRVFSLFGEGPCLDSRRVRPLPTDRTTVRVIDLDKRPYVVDICTRTKGIAVGGVRGEWNWTHPASWGRCIVRPLRRRCGESSFRLPPGRQRRRRGPAPEKIGRGPPSRLLDTPAGTAEGADGCSPGGSE